MSEENGPRGVFAKHFLGDLTLGQVLSDLSQRELLQLGDAVLKMMTVPVG